MAVSMVGLYLADIILLVAGPIALNNIGWKFFLVLIIPTAFHIVFVYFMCPETKGRSLVSSKFNIRYNSYMPSSGFIRKAGLLTRWIYRRTSTRNSVNVSQSTTTVPPMPRKKKWKRLRMKTRKTSFARGGQALVKRLLML